MDPFCYISGQYGLESDVYSLGITMLRVVAGRLVGRLRLKGSPCILFLCVIYMSNNIC